MNNESEKLYSYERFEHLLKARNLTVEYLAASIGRPGTDFTRWRNGAQPKADKLLKVADFFGVPLEYFYGQDKS